MAYLVGLDVGTTSSKAVVFDERGTEVARGRARTSWHTADGRTEADPLQLLTSARHALRDAVRELPPGSVVAVGVASMGESGVLLDRGGEPTGPLIAWHDTRDESDVEDFAAEFGADEFAIRTGLPLRSQWSFTKHRWLNRHSESTAAAVRRLGVAEYVVQDLGGDEASELSLASRTGWLDLTTRTWWEESLSWSGATAGLLAPLVTAGTALGTVTSPELPQLAGAVLTVAGHDHQAAAIGVGAIAAGNELDSCGTAEAVIRTLAPGMATDEILALTRAGVTVGWHALAGHWCLLGGTQGGLVLSQLLGRLGVDRAGLAALDAEALAAGSPAAGTPAAGAAAAGTVIADTSLSITGDDNPVVHGADDSTPASVIWRAALEEVTARAYRIHSAMSAVTGPHNRFVATAGWAHSAGLLEVKRRAFGPVLHSTVAEAGARGAALLAGVAAGVYRDTAEAVSATAEAVSDTAEAVGVSGETVEPASPRGDTTQ